MPNPTPQAAVADEAQRLQLLLTQLNLTAAASKLDPLLVEAQENAYSYSHFLSALLSAEAEGRLERKLTRTLKSSHLGPTKSLDEFDFSLRPKLTPPAVKELLDCRWIEQGRSILCVGRSGTGKTHLAKALGHAACLHGHSVLYTKAADLLDELHASRADHSYPRVFHRYTRVQLLICEELGYVPLDPAKAEYLFRLVSDRHPQRAMIVTANTGFENWGRFFPSKALAMATIDRLIDRATILRFTGKSCRKPQNILGDPLEEEEK